MQMGQGEKEAEEKGYPCCGGRLLVHKNIYTGTVSSWRYLLPLWKKPVTHVTPRISQGHNLFKSPAPSH